MIGNIGFVLCFVVVGLFLRRLPDLPAASPAGEPGNQAEELPHDRLLARSLDIRRPGHEPHAPGRGDHGLYRQTEPAAAQILTTAHVTPQVLTRAKQTLAVYGFKVTRIKTNTASLTVADPDAVIAWAVSHDTRGPVKRLTTRDLVVFATQVAGEQSEP